MEQMSLGIKFYAGSQVWPTNVSGKSRFGELSTDEIQQIMDNTVWVRTKKSHKVRDKIIQRYVSVKLPLKIRRLRIWQSKFYAFIKVLELKKTGSIASVVQKKIISREQLKKVFDSSELGPAGSKNSRTATECHLVFTSVSFFPDEDERINTS